MERYQGKYIMADRRSEAAETEVYAETLPGIRRFKSRLPFTLTGGGTLPYIELAYETWGERNEAHDNIILILCCLTVSSHASSHQDDPNPGWWERFVGPGRPLDTDRFHMICVNNLGGCHGSTGPASVDPETGQAYGLSFPDLSIEDIVRSQFLLLDALDIDRLHSVVGGSIGGMAALLAAKLFPARVNSVVTISSCLQAQPQAIAKSHLQRLAITSDPQWMGGDYLSQNTFPKTGLIMARQIAMLQFRAGPELDERFGRQQREQSGAGHRFQPRFEVEHYLQHHGEKFVNHFDPNSLLYLTKASDMYDICEGTHRFVGELKCPVLVIGVNTDQQFPVEQQREIATKLREAGNQRVTYFEIDSAYGHDTFLLDVNNVGQAVKSFLLTSMNSRETVQNGH